MFTLHIALVSVLLYSRVQFMLQAGPTPITIIIIEIVDSDKEIV